MTKIYEHSDDLHVRATVLYTNYNAAQPSATDYTPEYIVAYEDKELTKPVTSKALKNAFLKGCVITFGGDSFPEELTPYVSPMGFGYDDNGVAMIMVFLDGPNQVYAGEILEVDEGSAPN